MDQFLGKWRRELMMAVNEITQPCKENDSKIYIVIQQSHKQHDPE